MRLKEDCNKLRHLLKDDPLSWGELKQKTGWSTSVLKDRIDFMKKTGEITFIIGTRNRRRTILYTLADAKRSEAESGKYEATRLIDGLSKPVFYRSETKDKKGSVSAFISSVPDELREETQKRVKKIANRAVKSLFFTGKGLKHGQKIAVIFTVEG